MSHFATIKTALTSKECLIQGLKQALEKKGILLEINVASTTAKTKKDDESHYIKVVEHPERLVNEFDKNDKKYAEVIISRKALSTESYQSLVDVGYLWNQTTSQFELQLDRYDFRLNRLGAAFGKLENFNNAVQLEHDKIRLYEELRVNYPTTEWDYSEEVISKDGIITLDITKKPKLVEAWY